MDAHPTLTTFWYVALSVVAFLVVAYWIMYTRRMKTPPHVGKNEGIAMAVQHDERAHR